MGLGFSLLCQMAQVLNFEYKIAPAGWSEMGILLSACGLTWHIDVAKFFGKVMGPSHSHLQNRFQQVAKL
jgi:hypothetical protein